MSFKMHCNVIFCYSLKRRPVLPPSAEMQSRILVVSLCCMVCPLLHLEVNKCEQVDGVHKIQGIHYTVDEKSFCVAEGSQYCLILSYLFFVSSFSF